MGKYFVLQNAKRSFKQSLVHGRVIPSLYASLRCFPKYSFHSLKVTHKNSCWFSLVLSGTTRLHFPLQFGTKEMKFQSMTLNPHILRIGETPGSKPTGKLVWIFIFLITWYVFLKWSLTHLMKTKCNKNIINYLILDIYIGSSYTEKPHKPCQAVRQESSGTICSCSLVFKNYINLLYSHYVVICLIS